MRNRNPATICLLLFMMCIATAHAQRPAAPAIPEDARRYYVQANTRVHDAQSPDDYQQAAALYQQALAIAPHFGNAWYNLSKVQEKLGQYDDAIASLKHFLADSPNDPEARTAQDHEYELETKRDEKAKAVAAAQQVEADKAARVRDAQAKLPYLQQLLAGLSVQTEEYCINPRRLPAGGGEGSCTDAEAERGYYWIEIKNINGFGGGGEPITVTLGGTNSDVIEVSLLKPGDAAFCLPVKGISAGQTDFVNIAWSCGDSSKIFTRLTLNSNWSGRKAIYRESCLGMKSLDCGEKNRSYEVLGP